MAWFVADLVVLITVEGAEANVVHVNTVLIEADDAEDAWDRAHALGREGDQDYPNMSGQRVTCRFQGVRELTELWEARPEHGAELFFEEQVDVPPETLLRPKCEMSVFRVHCEPPDPRRPDYTCGEVVADAVEALRAAGVPHLRLVTEDDD